MRLKKLNLMEKLKNSDLLLPNTTNYIASLITILGAIASFILYLLHRSIFILVTFIAIFIISIIVLKISKLSHSQKICKPYEFVRYEVIYQIDEKNPKHHTSTINAEIKAMKPGVKEFVPIYRWTGQGREKEPKLLSREHSLTSKPLKNMGYKHYSIKLSHPLKLGETTVVAIQQEFYDIRNEFEPFLDETVFTQMDKLILRVILPKKHLPSSIRLNEFDDLAPKAEPIDTNPGDIDSITGEILWPIPTPRLRHKYQISWKY